MPDVSQSARPDGTAGSAHGTANEIEAELAAIRKDLSELAKSLLALGKGRSEEARAQAQEMSAVMIEGARKAIADLRTQLDSLEATVEDKVRSHPVPWFLGALGFGVILALILRRNH